jgi:hypothetical protein
MRTLIVLCAVLALSTAVFAQAPVPPRAYTGCYYNCGPYIPLVTTPMVSLETLSTAPAGARNATGGLVAGATNSTLSQISDTPDATATVPVWYSGATSPIRGAAVNVPVPGPTLRRGMHEHAMHEGMMMREHEMAEKHAWTYYSAVEETAPAGPLAASAKGAKKATRTITNDDINRINQQTGNVKYDGKQEKIQ